MTLLRFLVTVTAFLAAVNSAPVEEHTAFAELSIDERQVLTSPYAPINVTCPSGSLVRPATGLSSDESSYIGARKSNAAAALGTWLKKTNSGFSTSNLPIIGLTTSGGGYRSLLTGAGVIQAFDIRDSNVGTSGVFQGLTYQAGLSGGGWLLSSFAGNNYPTITSLRNNLWRAAFQNSLLLPNNILASEAYTAITNDVVSKDLAGFDPTLVDVYGRLLSYQLLYGTDGGVAIRLSTITGYSNFTSKNVPYPIITSLGVDTFAGKCLPDPNATQYEFGPYDFGSWDKEVSAFTKTAYLGTSLSNGVPTNGKCVMNYDNLGYIAGTTSNLFNELCLAVPLPTNSSNNLANTIAGILNQAHAISTRDEYAVYPNPFYKYPRSAYVAPYPELDLVDGGEALQNNPIWPFLQPSRNVGVLVVNDNSADTSDNFPNGQEIYTTYQQAQQRGLTKMPVIPPSSTFIAQGLNKRPTFFGCNDNTKITIVFIPNVNYTYPSNQPTAKLQYSSAETDAMIANGVLVGNYNNNKTFPTCLGCVFTKKTGQAQPAACAQCYKDFCYN